MQIFEKQTLLVVAPHPDDEVLGCGGLIKRIKDGGGKVYILFLTVGKTQEYSRNGESTIDVRRKEIEKVAKLLQYDDYEIAFPGNNFHLYLDRLPEKELIDKIEKGSRVSLNKARPDIVAIPPPYDYNQDHRSAALATLAATRPAPNDFKPFQKAVISYESVVTALWYDVSVRNPNFFLDLKQTDLKMKIDALRLYSSQLRTGHHPRSIQSLKNLAYFRGVQCGNNVAEAFYVYRMVI